MEDVQKLIKGCLQNDRKSQEQLYKQFYPVFFALCKRFFPDHHDILTALNNGMLKVFNNLHRYDASKGEFINWAYTIVRHAAISLIRNKQLATMVEVTDRLPDTGSLNPFRQLEWKEVYYYLDQLPPGTRHVCVLHYLEGFTIKEIAASVGKQEGTVKWCLHDGRSRLRSIFEQHNRNIRG